MSQDVNRDIRLSHMIKIYRRWYPQNQREPVCTKKWILDSLKHCTRLNEQKKQQNETYEENIVAQNVHYVITSAPSSSEQIVSLS